MVALSITHDWWLGKFSWQSYRLDRLVLLGVVGSSPTSSIHFFLLYLLYKATRFTGEHECAALFELENSMVKRGRSVVMSITHHQWPGQLSQQSYRLVLLGLVCSGPTLFPPLFTMVKVYNLVSPCTGANPGTGKNYIITLGSASYQLPLQL